MYTAAIDQVVLRDLPSRRVVLASLSRVVFKRFSQAFERTGSINISDIQNRGKSGNFSSPR